MDIRSVSEGEGRDAKEEDLAMKDFLGWGIWKS